MSKNDRSITEMSGLLLQGWTMMAEACPQCTLPLMKKPNSNVCLCVGCRGNFDTDSNYCITQNAKSKSDSEDIVCEDERLGPYAKIGSLPMHKRPGTIHDASSDSADKIAVKMMEGGILSDKYCPRCNTPLIGLVNESPSYFCVACNLNVISENEAIMKNIVEYEPAKEKCIKIEKTNSQELQKKIEERHSNSNSKNDENGNWHVLLMNSLVTKIKEARSELDRAQLSLDILKCMQIVEFIEKCVILINKIKRCDS